MLRLGKQGSILQRDCYALLVMLDIFSREWSSGSNPHAWPNGSSVIDRLE